MAHSAPATSRSTSDRSWPRRSVHLFSDRAHTVGRWAVPSALALVYGYWVAANRRYGGPVTAGNVAYGFVTAIVFTLVIGTMLTVAPRLPRELHAALWGVITGTALGFLISQASGQSVQPVFVVSFATALATAVIIFYWDYTHEDAQGHSTR